jgi:hypothetical protein
MKWPFSKGSVPFDNSVIRCKFCGRTQSQVSHLISGPGVYICAECVKLSEELLYKKGGIIRSIEFPPELREAGISILSYFGTVLTKKYPGVPTSVRIEQRGNTVRLVVATVDGMKESIEKTLDEYGKVVMGEMSPSTLLSNELDALALQQKLDLAQAELRGTRQLLAYSERNQEQRIAFLEGHVRELGVLLGTSIAADRQNDESPRGVLSITAGGDVAVVSHGGVIGDASQVLDIHGLEVQWIALEAELVAVRKSLEASPSGPLQVNALEEITRAESAVKERKGPEALRHLARAGKWAIDAATSIGCDVAAQAIARALKSG